MSARYEDDPRWQAAHAEWVKPRASDETPTAHYVRGVNALYAMHRVEVECETAVTA